MAFTVTDFEDLLKLLGDRPDWQAELRRLFMTSEFEAAVEAAANSATLIS